MAFTIDERRDKKMIHKLHAYLRIGKANANLRELYRLILEKP